MRTKLLTLAARTREGQESGREHERERERETEQRRETQWNSVIIKYKNQSCVRGAGLGGKRSWEATTETQETNESIKQTHNRQHGT
jgi:hypothetical protein